MSLTIEFTVMVVVVAWLHAAENYFLISNSKYVVTAPWKFELIMNAYG
jgi:hypothetical protein